MDRKPKINPKATYVFDEGELDQLDELSLTSVIAEATHSLGERQGGPTGMHPAAANQRLLLSRVIGRLMNCLMVRSGPAIDTPIPGLAHPLERHPNH